MENLAKIKNAPPKKQEKPATLALGKALSKNKEAAMTSEKVAMQEHEKTKKAALLKRVQEEMKKEQEAKKQQQAKAAKAKAEKEAKKLQ